MTVVPASTRKTAYLWYFFALSVSIENESFDGV